jgi:hypothetical protein
MRRPTSQQLPRHRRREFFFHRDRQREAKGRTGARRARQSDLAPVHLHERAGDHQAETRAARLLRCPVLRAEEAREDLRLLLRRHANAGVGDLHLYYAITGRRPNLNSAARRRVFVGVRQQIGQDLRQPVGISRDTRQCRRHSER